LKKIKRDLGKLEKLQKQVALIGEKAADNAEKYEDLVKRHDGSLAELRAEIEVLELQVGGLTYYHQELVERAKAALSAHVFRQVANLPPEKGDE